MARRKAKNPKNPGGDICILAVRVPRDLRLELRIEALKRGVSVQEFVRRAIEKELRRK